MIQKNQKNQQNQWIRLAAGTRARQHPTRKHGTRPDKYFVLRYISGGKHRQEALGWASDGWTLDKAQAELSSLKEAIRTGRGPISMDEKRKQAKIQRQAGETAKQAENHRLVKFADYWVEHYLPHA